MRTRSLTSFLIFASLLSCKSTYPRIEPWFLPSESMKVKIMEPRISSNTAISPISIGFRMKGIGYSAGWCRIRRKGELWGKGYLLRSIFFVCLFLSFSLGWFGFAGLFVGCTNSKRAKIINAACPVENMLGLGGSWWRVGGRVCVWCVCSLFYLGDVLADLSNCWNLAKADGPDLVVVWRVTTGE